MKKDEVIIYIEPYCYISVVNNDFIIYNTLDGNSIVHKDSYLGKYVRGLSNRDNLNVLSVSQAEKKIMKNFLKELRNKFCGDYFIRNQSNQNQPIQPVSFLKNELPISTNSPVLPENHLKKINLYINNFVSNSNDDVAIEKQFLWKLDGQEYKEIEYRYIYKLINEIDNTKVSLNILGGDLFEHSKFRSILNCIKEKKVSSSLFIYYSFLNERKIKEIIDVFNNIIILVDFNNNFKDMYDKLCKIIQKYKSNKLSFQFAICNLEEFNEASKIISLTRIKYYNIFPLYNGKNMSFFKREVYFRKNGLIRQRLTMREIYSRLSMNLNNYGRFTINPNGDIFSDMFNNKVGELYKDNIFDITTEEMQHGKGWRFTRNSVYPCNECVYKFLCPPISNYEVIFNKYDLCK